jgi:hypothetical protein
LDAIVRCCGGNRLKYAGTDRNAQCVHRRAIHHNDRNAIALFERYNCTHRISYPFTLAEPSITPIEIGVFDP